MSGDGCPGTVPGVEEPDPDLRARRLNWVRPKTWQAGAELVAGWVSACAAGLIALIGGLGSLVTARLGGPAIEVQASVVRLLAGMISTDRRRIARLAGVTLQPLAYPRIDPDASPGERQRSWARSPLRRSLPAYALIRLPVAVAALLASLAWWWGAFLCAELAVRRLELGFGSVSSYQSPVHLLISTVRPWHLSLFETLVAAAGCVAGVLLWPAAQRRVTELDARVQRSLGVWLLGPTTSELSREVVRLSETRAHAVTAADDERRRIERDLHDGFQPQLVNLALNLGLARSRLTTDPDAAQALLERAHEDAKRASEELRNLVRGIHPSVLDERGLDAAFSALAASSRVPLQIDVHLERRLAREVEGAAYFVVAEAVTNVNKHARASTATISVSEIEGALRVLVQDNGEGGAHAEPGGGLAGLADRIAGVDGTFSVTSPAGGPTWIEARIPCGR